MRNKVAAVSRLRVWVYNQLRDNNRRGAMDP